LFKILIFFHQLKGCLQEDLNKIGAFGAKLTLPYFSKSAFNIFYLGACRVFGFSRLANRKCRPCTQAFAHGCGVCSLNSQPPPLGGISAWLRRAAASTPGAAFRYFSYSLLFKF